MLIWYIYIYFFFRDIILSFFPKVAHGFLPPTSSNGHPSGGKTRTYRTIVTSGFQRDPAAAGQFKVLPRWLVFRLRLVAVGFGVWNPTQFGVLERNNFSEKNVDPIQVDPTCRWCLIEKTWWKMGQNENLPHVKPMFDLWKWESSSNRSESKQDLKPPTSWHTKSNLRGTRFFWVIRQNNAQS